MIRQHREVTVEIPATDSPQELAIRFLLRHAECLRMLTGAAVQQHRQPPAARPPAPEATTVRQAPLDAGKPVAAAVLRRTRKPAAEGSFSARFAQAYAAARHPSASKRTAAAGSRKATGSGSQQMEHAESAAA
jgi:hypothetical protein